MDIELDELYQELIMDHYKHPRCYGMLPGADALSRLHNPLCGDRVDVSVKVSNGTLTDIGFSGCGCSISRASASFMGELCRGKSVDQVRRYAELFHKMLEGQKKGDELVQLGDAQALAGVSSFPARIRCAMLAWEALGNCINSASRDKCSA